MTLSLFAGVTPAYVGGDPDGLRYYQRDAYDAVHAEFAKGVRSTMLVLATALGKTRTFSAIAKHWTEGDILVLAHRDELVTQARDTLEEMTGLRVEIEQGSDRASGTCKIVVGSVDSVKSLKRLERMGRERFGLVIVDECFPAGTLIDGRPIESIAVGDIVTAIDHATGQAVRRRVVRTFAKVAAESLIVLRSGATTVRCTGNHPVFVRRGGAVGYVEAKNIVPGDMLCLRRPVHEGDRQAPSAAQDMLEGVSVFDLRSEDGGDQPPLRERAHDRAESNAQPGSAREGVADAAADRPRTQDPGRQRHRLDEGAGGAAPGARAAVGGGACGADRQAAGQRLPGGLQAGPGASRADGGNRGRREQPLLAGQESAGRQEDGALVWSRVDGVARAEQPGGAAVYNLEVEGAHTYFANDVLVHNCHHYVGNTFVRPLEYFDRAKILGVTATPDRGDKKAMGRTFDSVAYRMDILDGIEQGWLVPFIAQEVFVNELDLSGIDTSSLMAAQSGKLDEVIVKAVEGIVKGLLEHAADRYTIAFFPGVASAELAAARLNEIRPGYAEVITGKTPDEQRREIVKRFRKREIRVLCNCMVATEGFDAPACDCVALCRPTLSRSIIAQQAGRGGRVLPNTVDRWPGRDQVDERQMAIGWSRKPNCLLLNFVGNAGKHDLAAPEDVLGGRYTDEEVKHAKKTRRGGEDVRDALDRSRAELKAAAQAMRSSGHTTAVAYDPFEVMHVRHDEHADGERLGFGYKPPSPGQTAMLRSIGLTSSELEGVSRNGASKLITSENVRKAKGLATYAQLRILRKYGVSALNVTQARAQAALDYIQDHYRDKSGYSPQELNRILRAREPGEE